MCWPRADERCILGTRPVGSRLACGPIRSGRSVRPSPLTSPDIAAVYGKPPCTVPMKLTSQPPTTLFTTGPAFVSTALPVPAGSSNTELSLTALKKPAISCSLSLDCRRPNGRAREQPMPSNAFTRSSSVGSRPRRYYPVQTQQRCCSGRCSLPVKSRCERSTAGRPSHKK